MGGHRLLDALFLCSRFMNNYGTTKFSGLLVKSSLTVVPNHEIKTHSSFLYIGERKNLQNRILLLKQDFLFIREGSETQS